MWVKIDCFSPTYPRKAISHLSSYDVSSPSRYNIIVVTKVAVSLVKARCIEHLPHASHSPRHLRYTLPTNSHKTVCVSITTQTSNTL